MDPRLMRLARVIFSPSSWITLAIIICINISISTVLYWLFFSGESASYEYTAFIWLLLWISGLISGGIFVSLQLGLWLATGVTRREVSIAYLIGSFGHAVLFTAATTAVVAWVAWERTGSIWGWAPGDNGNVIPLSGLTVAVIFASYAVSFLGGALTFTGFLRWPKLLGLGWLALTLLLPTGLLISGYVLALTQVAGVGPVAGSFWDVYAVLARWTGFAGVAVLAMGMPLQIGRTPAPAPTSA